MDRVDKYRTDPAYRAKVNKANNDRYHRKMNADPLFRKLTAAKGRISNATVSIERCTALIETLHKRIALYNSRITNDRELVIKLVRERENNNRRNRS